MMLKSVWHPEHPAHSGLGLLLWSIWFVVVYASLSVTCALAPPAPGLGPFNWLNAGLLVITLVTVIILLWWAMRSWRASRKFQGKTTARLMSRVAAGAHFFSAGATLIVGLPAIFLPPCV